MKYITLTQASQLVGIVSILLLFVIQFYIAITIKSSIDLKAPNLVRRLLVMIDTLVALILWVAVYVLFLFVARVLSYFQIATLDELRIISGFGSLIPLIGVVTQLYLARKVENKEGLI